jgi:hypothetical protein
LIDHLVESVLFSESSKKQRGERLFACGSAVGIGFTDNQMRSLVKFVKEQEAKYEQNIVTDDVSGFDAIHTEQTLLSTCAVDDKTHTHKRGLKRWNLANRRWVISSCQSVAAIGGKLYVKVDPGMINSGSKDTSRRNTRLKMIYTHYFCLESNQPAKLVVANGDDGMTIGINNVQSYIDSARRHNVTVRDCIEREENFFEFCSHRYNMTTGVASLVTWRKAVYKLLTNVNLYKLDARQVLAEARHNSEAPQISAFVEKLDVPLMNASLL